MTGCQRMRDYEPYILRSLIVALLLSSFLVLCRAPLTESYWLDEAISAWVISGDFATAIGRAWEYRQSVVYHSFLWLLTQVRSADEVILRLPSVFFTLFSTFLTFRVGMYLSSKKVGLLAAILFLLSETTVVSEVSARPYALAQCAFLICVERLFAFRLKPRTVSLAVGAIAFGIAVGSHYLFALALLVPLFLASRAYVSCEPRARARLLLFGLFLVGASFVGLSIVWSWKTTGPQLGFAMVPTLDKLALAIFTPALLVYLSAPLALGLIYSGWKAPSVSKLDLMLVVLWAVAGPILFFLMSKIGDQSIWMSRYWSWQNPGAAILGGLLLSSVMHGRTWWVSLVGLFALTTFRESTRQWHTEPWREVAAAISSRSGSTFCPDGYGVITGLIEAKDSTFAENEENFAYLTAPLGVYGVPSSRIRPLWEDVAVVTSKSKCLAGVASFQPEHSNPVFDRYLSLVADGCGSGLSERTFELFKIIECSGIQ